MESPSGAAPRNLHPPRLPATVSGRNLCPSMRFRDALLSMMDRKNHWAWPYFSGPQAPRRHLLIHYQQEYLTYVRDFPQFLGRIHGQCPDPASRRLLAENLYEEETGGLSRTAPHPDLFLKMMSGLGFNPGRFSTAHLLPAAARYRRWLDRATQREPWFVGAAVVTIFVEGSVNDRVVLANGNGASIPQKFDPRNEPLFRHHGVPASLLTLKRAHARVENGHRQAAWEIVERHAKGASSRAQVIDAVKTSLRLWLAFRDGVATAVRLVPPDSVR